MKMKFIFLPFLWLSLLFVFAYLTLFWLFAIKLQLFAVSAIIDFWLPFVLSVFVVLFFRPFQLSQEFSPYLYKAFMFIAVFVNAIPLIAGCSFIRSGFANISQIQSACGFFVLGMLAIILVGGKDEKNKN